MPDDIDNKPDDIQAKIDAAVAAAVDGLKKTNTELKTEKTQLKDEFTALKSMIESLGGEDTLKQLGNADAIKNLAEMKKRFEADEQGQLLSQGKYDEWFDKRTSSMRKDYESQMKKMASDMEALNGKVVAAEGALRKKFLETEVSAACMDAGVQASAMTDVQLRAASSFHFDQERNRLVLKDEDGAVVFGKDGASPKTVREWLEDSKEVASHWWPPSKGGGADGSGRGGDKSTDLSKLSFAEYASKRKEQGFKPF